MRKILLGASAVVVVAACGARGSLDVASSSPSGGGGGAGGATTSSATSSTTTASSSTSSSTTTSSSSTTSSTSSSTTSSSGVAGGPPVCTPEVCDGLDNDCDGVVDDGDPGGGVACVTGKSGPCAAGVTHCSAGAIVCFDTVKPVPEVCGNGIDDDCNGLVDDGCATGCSDGTREGFVDQAAFPDIAGCSGGWSLPGLLDAAPPACGRVAGNSSANPAGMGCDVADLCAIGFHVCEGAADVAARSPKGCAGAANAAGLFFATRQSSTGCGQCALGSNTDPSVCNGCSCAAGCAQTKLTANDLFGCGSLGDVPAGPCGVLDRFSNDTCDALGPPWSCGTDGCGEANAVTKASSAGGGVLCCRD